MNTLNIEPRLVLWRYVTKKYGSAKDNNYQECFRWYEKNVRNNRGTKVSAKRWLWQKLRKPRIYSFSAITNFKLLKEIVITSQVVEDEWMADLQFKGTENSNKLSWYVLYTAFANPPKFCISIGTDVVPTRNEKQRLRKILGPNKVHCGKCTSGVLKKKWKRDKVRRKRFFIAKSWHLHAFLLHVQT